MSALSVCLSLYFPHTFSLSFSLSLCLNCLPLSPCLALSPSLSVCLSVYFPHPFSLSLSLSQLSPSLSQLSHPQSLPRSLSLSVCLAAPRPSTPMRADAGRPLSRLQWSVPQWSQSKCIALVIGRQF